MIEKVFEKHYSLTAPQATLTRVANRMLKEFEEACGEPDEEVKELAEKIKKCEDVDYDYDNSSILGGDPYRVYDRLQYNTEQQIYCVIDSDEYGEPFYLVKWYFFTSDVYSKHIGGKEIKAGDYSTILKKVTAAKGKYRYYCTYRPPARYCIPEGYVSYDVYGQGCEYCGEATYDRELSREECHEWGLRLDKDWAEQRKAILGDDDNG